MAGPLSARHVGQILADRTPRLEGNLVSLDSIIKRIAPCRDQALRSDAHSHDPIRS